MTASFGRTASRAAPVSVRIGTNVSSRTHDCESFALIESSVTPRTGARLVMSPDCDRICPGTTPTRPASTNVASSLLSRARMRPRVVLRRIIRTRRPGERFGRIASGDQSIFHAPLSFSPMKISDNVVVRRTSPTRCVWNVMSSGTVARFGSGEPPSSGRDDGPTRTSSERSVISSAMRGRRSTNPSVPTRCCASEDTSAHIAW